MSQQPHEFIHPLDKPIRGARAIAKTANLFDENGDPDERAAFYALEKGYIDASKEGRTWITTARRILKTANGEAA
jgi:hypothetical protein